jgi:hypothetical protein
MYSFQSKSGCIIFLPRRVEAGLYIYSSQLSSIGTNRLPNQNFVIRDLKTLYMLWQEIRYPMYSFQCESACIIYIPLPVKARLYIEFTIKFKRNESPGENSTLLFAISKRVICRGQEQRNLCNHSNHSLIA